VKPYDESWSIGQQMELLSAERKEEAWKDNIPLISEYTALYWMNYLAGDHLENPQTRRLSDLG
jgi:hypothetical protein